MNASYLLVIGEGRVYWDTPPELDGAQFSFEYYIYDENNTKIAEGLMDSTCGFLETMQGVADLTLTSAGNFMISRNRWNMLLWTGILSIVIPLVIFIYMKKNKVEKDIVEEVMLLFGIVISVNIIDIIVDVWFYSRFGLTIMLLMHLGLFVAYALICLRLGYGIKWALPALLEVAFVFAMSSLVGDPVAPHITAFMGGYCAYLAILYRSGFPKRDKADRLSLIA